MITRKIYLRKAFDTPKILICLKKFYGGKRTVSDGVGYNWIDQLKPIVLHK
jgi:hypothetical protein